MSPRTVRTPLVPILTALLALGAFGACADGPVAAPEAPDVRLNNGKGNGSGGGGTESTEDPVVDSVDPDSATQDTILDVLVQGSNFDEGSVVEWELDGELTTAIVTLQTDFVNSKRLAATIQVAVDAPLELYDVAVRTSRGRRGVGIELFEVQEEEPSISVTFADGAEDEITSDGRGAYVDGHCGVDATLNLGDARLGMKDRVSKRTCDGAKEGRVIRFTGFPESSPGGSEREGRFMIVNGQPVGTTLEDFRDFPLDTPMETWATFNAEGCAQQLKFAEDLGGDWVEVTRTSLTTWTVRTKPAPANRAVCLDRDGNVKFGGPLHLDFEATVELLP